jgi:hypothetical protein
VLEDLDQYLRANRDRYTRDALTAEAIKAGHEPADVEAAWQRIDRADAGLSPSSPPAGRPGLGTVLLIGAIVLGYGYAALAGISGIGLTAYYGRAGGAQAGSSTGATILMAVYVIAMLVGLVYSARQIYRAPSLGRGASAIGGALAISLVVLVGMNGACFAAVLAGSAMGGL